MNLTKITLYQNTPLTDFNNTMNFESNEARDAFFDSHYSQKTSDLDFNFIRDRLILKIGANTASWSWLNEVNYCRFTSEFDGITYYAQVVDTHYTNLDMTELYLVIDGLMTFCQGNIAPYMGNVFIERQSLDKNSYEENNYYLRTNEDVLGFKNVSHIHTDSYLYHDFIIVMTSTVDLEADFGSVDDPKLKTAYGQKIDKVVGPQNVYYCSVDDFPNIMKKLQDFPWISQNINSCTMVPKEVINATDQEPVGGKSFDASGLFKFPDGEESQSNHDVITTSWADFYNKMGIELVKDYPELIRTPYMGLFLTNFQGQDIPLDPAKFKADYPIRIRTQTLTGFHTTIKAFPADYQNNNDELGGGYLEQSINFNQFDQMGMLVDNYKLQMASNAHQRALNNNNQISGQIGNVLDNSGNTSLQDRFMSAVNLINGGLSIANLGGKFIDEWQYYRRQNAQFEDMAISKPTLVEGTYNNSFNIKNDVMGIFLRYTRIDLVQLQRVLNYHQNFGYQWQAVDTPTSIRSMSHVNYLKVRGNWVMADRKVPQSIMEQIRVQLEGGVKFWHNPNNLDNPFTEYITFANRRVL